MNRKKIFSLSIIFMFVISLLYILLTNCRSVDGIFFLDEKDSFMDFFNLVNHAKCTKPYAEKLYIYPPICFIIFKVISFFVPQNLIDGIGIAGGSTLKSSQQGVVLLMIISLVTILILYEVLCKFCELKGCKDRKLVLIILFTSQFLYEYERANIIVLSLILVLLFFIYNDSENYKNRLLSYLFLALAASIKMYPAIYGLLILKRRNWKEIIVCVLLGVFFFFIPFVFAGGIIGIKDFINNLFIGSYNTTTFWFRYKISFYNIILSTISFINGNDSFLLSISKIIALTLSIISIIVFFISKEEWKELYIITAVMIGLPTISFVYTMIFMVIPLITFLFDKKKEKTTIIYLILFVGCFSTIIFGSNLFLLFSPRMDISFNTYVQGFSMLLMLILIDIETIIKAIKSKE